MARRSNKPLPISDLLDEIGTVSNNPFGDSETVESGSNNPFAAVRVFPAVVVEAAPASADPQGGPQLPPEMALTRPNRGVNQARRKTMVSTISVARLLWVRLLL